MEERQKLIEEEKKATAEKYVDICLFVSFICHLSVVMKCLSKAAHHVIIQSVML